MQYANDCFETMCIDGNTAWLSTAEGGVFCECSYPDFEVKKVIEYPKEIRELQVVFINIKKYNNYLVFIPRNEERLMIYDCGTGKIRLINLYMLKPKNVKTTKNPIMAIWVKGLLHLYSIYVDKYVVLDLNTLEISCRDNLYVEAYSKPEFWLRQRVTPEKDDCVYWFWSQSNNHLTRWNSATEKREIIYVGRKDEIFKLCLNDGRKCWLVQMNTDHSVVVSYDLDSKVTEYYPVPNAINGTSCNGIKCMYAIKIKDELFFFPLDDVNIVSMNMVTKKFRRVIFSETGVKKYAFTAISEYGRYIYMYEAYTGKIVEIDKENINRRRWISIKYNEEYDYMVKRNCLKSGNPIQERRKCKLDDLIDYISIS